MKAAIYARVSTERQAERGTIGSQLEALRAHVTAAGGEIAGEECVRYFVRGSFPCLVPDAYPVFLNRAI